jgi:hypothetical protein
MNDRQLALESLHQWIGFGLGIGRLPYQVIREAKEKYPEAGHLIYEAMVEQLHWEKQFQICERIGHNITHAESSFGPDSGTETLYCGRCGASHDIIFY